MKLVYINNGKSTVFDSQVLSLLQHYVKMGWFDQVVLIFGYQNIDEIKWLDRKNTDGILIYYYKSFPNYPFFNFMIRRNLYKSIREISVNFQDHFFHIRGEMMALHFKSVMTKLNINQKQLLTDVRGVSIQELEEFSKANKLLKALKLKNYRLAFNHLSYDLNISVVSNFFKEYLLSKPRINQKSVYVNSCLVDESFTFNIAERIKTRKELGIKEKEILLIFTSGGSANWQNNDMIIQLADIGVKILNLSKKEVNYRNVINLFVSYSKVPSFLCAADIAFIWRDESLVNKVASPVKLSEYLACGLPIIHNGTVNLINDLTTIGVDALCVDKIHNLSLSMIHNIVSKVDRLELSGKGKSIFGVSKIAQSYKKIYLGKK